MDPIREPLSEVSLQQIAFAARNAVSAEIRAKGVNADRRDSGGMLSRKGRASRGAAMNPLGRNKRSVWVIPTNGYQGAHFAVFPPDLIEPCILAGSRKGDIVLDPFMGSGTTAAVAIANGRQYLGCELNPEYKALQDKRILAATPAAENDADQQQLDLA